MLISVLTLKITENSSLFLFHHLRKKKKRDLVKKAKAESENAKIGLRNNRKDALDMIKELKNDGLSEDMMKDAENEVQNITNEFSNKIDEFLSVKERDIMTV